MPFGIRAAHQFLVFSIPGPLQKAAARALLDHAETWDEELLAGYGDRRRHLLDGLRSCGLDPIEPEGTYFILADCSVLGDASGQAFCERLLESVQVAAVPCSIFTRDGTGMTPYVRFAFCKPKPVLDEALSRLRDLATI